MAEAEVILEGGELLADALGGGATAGEALTADGLAKGAGSSLSKYGLQAAQALGESGTGAVIAEHVATGLEDFFETDAALERKKQSKERGEIIKSDMRDRALARRLARDNYQEGIRRQLKKEELQQKLLDRELAGGKPLGYVPPDHKDVTPTMAPSFTPAPSVLGAYDANLAMQRERQQKMTKNKLDTFGKLVNSGLDIAKGEKEKELKEKHYLDSQLQKEKHQQMSEDALQKQKMKYKRKKAKALSKQQSKMKQKQDLDELERKAEKAKSFLREHDALTKKQEKNLDALELRKELGALRKLEAEERMKLKREDEALRLASRSNTKQKR